ncbi:MAG: pantetheine-phosphate adenylyltransferase [Candidatus Heimdallarchaeota archaeon]|nr:pantetheine-phosphate adenylyltransferase [Candidatus Heimdallarchaeota archaeon]
MGSELENYSTLLKKFGLFEEKTLEIIVSAWKESHRYWHTYNNHLLPLLERIDEKKRELSEEEYEGLVMIAIFHDIVYDPRREDNEEQSARVFKELTKNSSHPLKDQIERAILDTAEKEPSSKISRIFQKMDTKILRSNNITEILRFERAIFKEYQYLDFKTYQKERLNFLNNWLNSHSIKEPTALEWLIEYIRREEPKIGVYAGSFDPFHKGHFDVLKKAERVFDKVILAVGTNPEKAEPNKDLRKRVAMLKQSLPFHQVEGFQGFLTDFIKQLGYKVTLVRGLRDSYDLTYENNQLRLMEDMYPQVNVVYFLCSSNLQHISSSAVRMIRSFNKGREKKYLVKAEKNILEKLGLKNKNSL